MKQISSINAEARLASIMKGMINPFLVRIEIQNLWPYLHVVEIFMVIFVKKI